MRKIWLVIQREYLSRVKKKSFIIMTLLGPILVALFYGAIIWISLSEEEEPHTVMVVDESFDSLSAPLQTYAKRYPQSSLYFTFGQSNVDSAVQKMKDGNANYQSVLYIPAKAVAHPDQMILRYKSKPTSGNKDALEAELERIVENIKIEVSNLTREDFDAIRQKLNIKMLDVEKNREDHDEIKFAIGFAACFLIYLFIFLYGVQVLRGVMEEKTNRIVEVVISSVRPFQLMMGKIIGIAMVGLTQFLIWVLFSGIALSIVSVAVAPDVMEQVQTSQMESQLPGQNEKATEILSGLQHFPFGLMFFLFIFYFLGGYLLYAALFAAIGAAVDSETDTQQFMMPVSLPIIFSIAISQLVMKNPDGTLGTIFSLIPFTSPIVMMVRIPFEVVTVWELIASMALLVAGFVGTTWFASRIYRVGILMYGKKVTYKELWKWLFYKG